MVSKRGRRFIRIRIFVERNSTVDLQVEAKGYLNQGYRTVEPVKGISIMFPHFPTTLIAIFSLIFADHV